jgi:oligosaccharide repeat unit polymerase
MIFAFLGYLFYVYFFTSENIISLNTLTLFYVLLSIQVGEITIVYSAQWVGLTDFSFLDESLFYLKTGFYIILFTILFFQFLTDSKEYKKNNNYAIDNLIIKNISWPFIILISIPLYWVFFDIYFPVFQEKTFVSKYFQDRLVEFIPYRPYYTLAINGASTFLFLQINYFLFSYRKVNFKRLLLNKNFLKLFFLTTTLFFTAKRGQLITPFFISLLSYMFYKRNYIKLLFGGFSLIIFAALSRSYSKILNGTFTFDDIIMSLSTSFFVSVRELTRVLTAFNEKGSFFVYGKTYIAGFFSFIPTKINTFKEKYNYMRYTTHLFDGDPDLFGGMRSTYVGEAYVNYGFLGVIVVSFILAFIIFFLNLQIAKYSRHKFLYYLFTFWILKLITMPLFENGSSMFLFFLIVSLFMMLPSLKLVLRKSKIILKILFLIKKQ